MSIEIRPNGVSDQVAAKANLLSEISSELAARKDIINAFIDSPLTSDGYEALKARVETYPVLIAGLEYAATLTMQADQTVESALGRFGGVDKISEQELLDKQNDALDRVAGLEAQYSGILKGSCTGLASDFLGNFIANAQLQADAAGEMLSDVYSYCEETNNVYQNVEDIYIAIDAGFQAFSNAAAGKGNWPTLTNSGWIANLKIAVANGRPMIENADQIYDGETLNTEACSVLFGIPFELWGRKEQNAMLLAYDAMWVGDSGQPDLVALEALIKCGYFKGEKRERPGFNRLEDRPETVQEYHLGEGFLGFTNAYIKENLKYLGTEKLDQAGLRGTFLFNIATHLDSMYGYPDFTLTPVRYGEVGIQENADDLFSMTLICENSGYSGKGETNEIVTSSVNCQRFISWVIGQDLSGITKEEISIFESVLGTICTANPVADAVWTSFSNFRSTMEELEINQTVKKTIDLVEHKDFLSASFAQSSVSIVNGQTHYYHFGYDVDEMDAALEKYYLTDEDPKLQGRLTSEIVIKCLEEYGADILTVDENGSVEEIATNAFLNDNMN